MNFYNSFQAISQAFALFTITVNKYNFIAYSPDAINFESFLFLFSNAKFVTRRRLIQLFTVVPICLKTISVLRTSVQIH